MIANAPTDTLCLVRLGRNESGAACGLAAPQIREGGSGPSDDSGTLSELVPDGVATVTFRFAAARGRPAYSITGRAVGNLVVVRAPHLLAGSSDQPTVVWRAADGRILRTITPPTPAQYRAYCRQHVAQCLLATPSSASASGGVAVSSSSSSASATTASAAPPQ